MIIDIWDRIFKALAKDASMKTRSLSGKLTVPTAHHEYITDSYVHLAYYAPPPPDTIENCIDWYLITYNVATGEIITSTYLWRDCGPQNTGGSTSIYDGVYQAPKVLDSVDLDKLLGYCEDDYTTAQHRCIVQAQLYTALAFSGGIFALISSGIFSGGTLASGVIYTFEAAIVAIASNYTICQNNARFDYDKCCRRAREQGTR